MSVIDTIIEVIGNNFLIIIITLFIIGMAYMLYIEYDLCKNSTSNLEINQTLSILSLERKLAAEGKSYKEISIITTPYWLRLRPENRPKELQKNYGKGDKA